MRGLVVKPRARILHGHDWVLQVKSSRRLEPVDGDEVSLKAETGSIIFGTTKSALFAVG